MYDGVQLSEEGDRLAAFDSNGNVRGLAVQISPTFGPYEGTILYELTMGSNTDGDILSFQYYDASADEVLDIAGTYAFETNAQLGTLVAPYELNILTTVDLSIDLNAGWNWISFNVVPEDATLNAVLAELSESATFIASQASGIASNYGEWGWQGSLGTLDPGSGYLLVMSAADELVYPEFDGLARLADNKQ